MATPQTPYDAVLHAARDVTRLDCALDAEMLGTALLGSVYAIAETDRDTAVREFVAGFLAATSRRRDGRRHHHPRRSSPRWCRTPRAPPGSAPARRRRPGPASSAGSASPAPGRTATCTATRPPTWPPSPTTTRPGGPEHALVALVDHNIGITKDVFVGGPADRILEQVRQMCADDELTWFREEDPARMHGEVGRHLAITDDLGDLPAEGSLATDRALVGRAAGGAARGEPPAPPTGRAAAQRRRAHRRWSARFLASPEAARFGLDTVDGDARAGLAALLPGPALRPRGELPGRRPAAVEPGGGRVVPARLGAPAGRAGHGRRGDAAPGAARLGGVRGPPAGAARRAGTQTDEAIEEMVPEFARLYSTGERRSPATAAVAQLMADGVDPDDPVALDAWIEANRQRLGDDTP